MKQLAIGLLAASSVLVFAMAAAQGEEGRPDDGMLLATAATDEIGNIGEVQVSTDRLSGASAHADGRNTASARAERLPVPALEKPPVPPSHDLEALLAPERRIARALFLSQRIAQDSAPAWSLERIVAAKGAGGWEEVLRQLREDKLIAAEDLAQVLRQAARPRGARRGEVVVITTASGDQITAASN